MCKRNSESRKRPTEGGDPAGRSGCQPLAVKSETCSFQTFNPPVTCMRPTAAASTCMPPAVVPSVDVDLSVVLSGWQIQSEATWLQQSRHLWRMCLRLRTGARALPTKCASQLQVRICLILLLVMIVATVESWASGYRLHILHGSCDEFLRHA